MEKKLGGKIGGPKWDHGGVRGSRLRSQIPPFCLYVLFMCTFHVLGRFSTCIIFCTFWRNNWVDVSLPCHIGRGHDFFVFIYLSYVFFISIHIFCYFNLFI